MSTTRCRRCSLTTSNSAICAWCRPDESPDFTPDVAYFAATRAAKANGHQGYVCVGCRGFIDTLASPCGQCGCTHP